MTEEQIEKEAHDYDRRAHCGYFAGEDPSYHWKAGYHFRDKLSGWISVKERLPDKLKDDLKVLVNKRYDWERLGKTGHYFERQILVFNPDHNCWDDESGDDYDCDVNKVTHWMPLPATPE